MKSILISIRPKYCELIASGRKTIEVRKTQPKCDIPFKCYIYCTKADKGFKISNYYDVIRTQRYLNDKGKVMGEFVCDRINRFLLVGATNSSNCEYRAVADNDTLLSNDYFEQANLTEKDINKYLNGRIGYGYHISDLKIYDKPKELSWFCFPPERFCEKNLCGGVSTRPIDWA